MGCDIHLSVEKKVNGVWTEVPAPLARPDKAAEGDDFYSQYRSWFPGRNYSTFAILADVRNGYGFAGCDTGNGFNPIDKPRGIPQDVSYGVLKEYANTVVKDDPVVVTANNKHYNETEEGDWMCSREQADGWVSKGYSQIFNLPDGEVRMSSPDWHSASWFTLKELQDYDWTQITAHRGVVDVVSYAKFKKNHNQIEDTMSICGDVSGGITRYCSNEEMDRHVEKLGGVEKLAEIKSDRFGRRRDLGGDLTVDGFDWFTRIQWNESYRESVGDWFFETFLKNLETIANEAGGPDNVRIVFFFDN